MLIIDDSEDDAMLIARSLRRGGFELQCLRVDSAAGVATALRDERGWDVIACDFVMPGLDAADALDAAHNAIPSVPIVLICGGYPHDLWHEVGSGLIAQFVSKDRLANLPDVVRLLLSPPDQPSQSPRQGDTAARRDIVQ